MGHINTYRENIYTHKISGSKTTKIIVFRETISRTHNAVYLSSVIAIHTLLLSRSFR